MSRKESLLRQTLIIGKLRKRPSTYKEILDHLETEGEIKGFNLRVSKRTLQRDIQDIGLLYNINIAFDFSRKVYYIENDNISEAKERILEMFDLMSAFDLSDKWSKFVNFEKRKPQGTEHLYELLHAIKNRNFIQLEYQKFEEEVPSIRKLKPLALKEFKHRWYLIAEDQADMETKCFALDRVIYFEFLKSKFPKPDFDVHKHFQHCYGIAVPKSGKPTEIILSFKPVPGKYIKSLPLHHSQQIIRDDKSALEISLYMYITNDFIMELKSFGDTVTVIKPKHLARTLTKHARAVINQYSE